MASTGTARAAPKGATFQLGTLMRRWRDKNGLSQREVAMRLGYKNINFISMLEHGASSIPLNRVVDVAKAYEMPKEMALVIAATASPDIWNTFMALNDSIFKSRAITSATARAEEIYHELLNDCGVK